MPQNERHLLLSNDSARLLLSPSAMVPRRQRDRAGLH